MRMTAIVLAAFGASCEKIEYEQFNYSDSSVELPDGVRAGAGMEGTWARSDSAGTIREVMTNPYRLWLWVGGVSRAAEVSFSEVTLEGPEDEAIPVPIAGTASWTEGPDGLVAESVARGLELEYGDYELTGIVEIRHEGDTQAYPFRIELRREYSTERKNRQMERLRG